MQTEFIKQTLQRLERLMHGHNYEVCFGVEVFENCKSYDDLILKLREKYPDSNPENVTPLIFETIDFWNEINYGLNYRGDSSAGLVLSEKALLELEQVQDNYKKFVTDLLVDVSIIYFYPDEAGLPCYSVFWDYRFFLFDKNNNCTFIYGSASD